MKILLTAINAKYIHSNLAVYSLQAYAGSYKKYVELAEYTINNSKEHILQEIYKAEPDVLCFSCYIWNIEYVRSVAGEFHKLRPEVPIWAGGPEVSYETDAFLNENKWCTGIMVGEGEETFKDIAKFYLSESEDGQTADDNEPAETKDFRLEDIPGIVFKGKSIIHTPSRQPLDMDTIPFCYDSLEDFEHRIIYYESSRGCPFSCSYCLSSVDKRLRFRSNSLVLPELQFFIDRKVPQVKFVDRTFNCDHGHAMEIWRYIADHDNGVTNFHFEISADLLRDDEIELLSSLRPGLVQLEIGVQSTNEQTISEIHRTMKLDSLKRAVKKIQEAANIHEHLDLIAGLPFEDLERFKTSFNDIYALKPDQLQLGFLKVLKGSYMYEHAAEYDVVYTGEPPYEVMQTRWLGFTDLLEIKRVEEMLEVYYNSGQFGLSIRLAELLHGTAYEMFRGLGAYYEKNGLFDMSHSRMRRAEIFLDYIEELMTESAAKDDTLHSEQGEDADLIGLMMKEALTYDLYSRENCKTRPAWAPDISTFKAMTHSYCPDGKMSHIEPFHFDFPDKAERTLKEFPPYSVEPVWILFHYNERDPLDNQAAAVKIVGQK